MKKLLSLLLTILIIFTVIPIGAISVSAATSGTTGDCTWTLDGNVLTISGHGKMADYDEDTNPSPWCLSNKITEIIVENGVTSIGAYAFEFCYSLTSITIGNSVTSIGRASFYYCESLTSIAIPDSVTSIDDYAFKNTAYYNDESNWGNGVLYIGKHLIESKTSITGSYQIKLDTKTIADSAFFNCESLTSITMPDSVTSIGDYAFQGCTSLTNITISNSVASIGSYAFYYCESLTSITIPDSVTSIGYYAFDRCYSLTSITIGNGIINWSKFFDRTSITSITVSNSVTSIGDYAFQGYTSLTSITLPDSVTSIGDYAFQGCTSLTSITLPGSVTSIGGYAFEDCTSLTNITIPDSVTSIDYGAFQGCTSLKSVTIGKGVTSIDSYVFEGCTCLTSITVSFESGCFCDVDGVLFSKDKTEILCFPSGRNASFYVLPDSVTSIDYGAFQGCTSLTSITLPDSVTNIGGSAFSGCSNLTNIEISDGVTSIGYSAFYNCTSLKSIIIPDTVTSIGSSVFQGCTSLTSITLPDSVTSIDYSTFQGCTSLTNITIPDSVTSIGSSVFQGCTSLISITLPDSVTSIEYSTFQGCISLTSITIPDSVTSIGYSAFQGCTSLTSITLPDSVTSIGGYAFKDTAYYSDESNWKNGVLYISNHLIATDTSLTSEYTVKENIKCIADSAFGGCTSLTSITIPDSVTSIGYSAFQGCTSLTSITIIPGSVTSIGGYAFQGCTSLTNITIPNSVTSIGDYAFKNTAYYNDESNWENGVLYISDHLIEANYTISGDYTIRDGTKYIGDSAFSGCSNLTNIEIPDSVTSIGVYAFGGCNNLTTITVPDSVIEIREWAFGFCDNLKKVTIGSGAASIVNCFYNSKNLTTITVADDNKYYCDIDGVLFNKNKTELICYPAGKSAEFYAIPNGVTSIYFYAFARSDSLTSISIPNSVVYINGCAFDTSELLNTVYYCGTEEEWNNIFIGDVGNGYMSMADRYYHNFSEEFTIIDATDFEDGVKSRHCLYCDDMIDVTVIPKTSKISGVCGDGVYWAIKEGGILKIGGTGSTYGYTVATATPWYDYSDEITAIEIADTIMGIGNFNFYSLNNLEKVTVNNPDMTFGKRVFKTGTTAEIQAKGGSSVETYAKANNITFVKPQNPKTPLAPIMQYRSGYSITLKTVLGYEYSMDGVNWQQSPTFENLTLGTSYSFYQRIAENVYAPSAKSTALTVTTLSAPNAPTVESVDGQKVTLTKIDHYEYSMDGKTWQKSNVFLTAPFDKTLCFYTRKSANGGDLESPASEATKILIISAPKVFVGFDTLRIVYTEGYEYSYDGKIWQDSNFFEVLDGEYYTLYHRPKENPDGITVFSNQATTVFTNGRNIIENPTADDLVWIKKRLLFLDGQNNLAADVNADGEVNVLDYIALQKLLLV